MRSKGTVRDCTTWERPKSNSSGIAAVRAELEAKLKEESERVKKQKRGEERQRAETRRYLERAKHEQKSGLASSSTLRK